ncbi:hypothetical protein KBI23_13905 [bacterium]|nr:hypothetical protein [bacterium]
MFHRFNPVALARHLNTLVKEGIEELFESAPYRIRQFSTSLNSNPSNTDGEFARKEALFRQWLARDQITFGKKHTECAGHLVRLGDLHASEFWPAMGLPYYDKALKIYEVDNSLESSDLRVIALKGKMADCYLASGQFDVAEPLIASVAAATLASECGMEAKRTCLERWKNCLEEQGKFAESNAVFQRIIAMYEEPAVLNYDLLSQFYRDFSVLSTKSGGNGEVAALYLALAGALTNLSVMENACGKESHLLRRDLETVIELYLQCGRTELAARLAGQVKLIDLLVKVSREDCPTMEKDLEQIALHYDERDQPGDSSLAHRYRQRAQVVAERRAAKLTGRRKAKLAS